MGYVKCSPRQLALVVNVAGLPGIQLKAFAASIRPGTEDAPSQEFIAAWSKALPEVWDVLSKYGLLEMSEPMLKKGAQLASQPANLNHKLERVRKTAIECQKELLEKWPEKQPDMASPAYGKVLNIQAWQDEGTESQYEPVDNFIG